MKRELPNSVYRADPSGKLDLVIGQDQIPNPNGLAFSPDYKKLYVISTGRGPGDAHAGGNRDMHVFDVAGNNKLSSQKLFADFMIDGIKCGPDGVRADVYGNLWVSSNGNPGGRGERQERRRPRHPRPLPGRARRVVSGRGGCGVPPSMMRTTT